MKIQKILGLFGYRENWQKERLLRIDSIYSILLECLLTYRRNKEYSLQSQVLVFGESGPPFETKTVTLPSRKSDHKSIQTWRYHSNFCQLNFGQSLPFHLRTADT